MGLVRGMARTAVVAGTATAVSNRVARRQHGRWAEQEAKDQAYAQQQAGQQYAPPPPQYAQPPQQYAPAPADPPGQGTDDLIARLQRRGVRGPEGQDHRGRVSADRIGRIT